VLRNVARNVDSVLGFTRFIEMAITREPEFAEFENALKTTQVGVVIECRRDGARVLFGLKVPSEPI